MIKRRRTRRIKTGQIAIGGDAPVSVQSMTTTDTRDPVSTARQIRTLVRAGCDIVRVAVPDRKAAEALGEIRKRIGNVPLVADIHFDHRLALTAIGQGVDKVRINPGNIGSAARVREVVAAARDNGVPIRIGVNAGSVQESLRRKHKGNTAAALVESALREARLLEKQKFEQIVVSLKASNVYDTLAAYRMISRRVRYPLHVGVTEAGLPAQGTVTSSIGIGALLLEGIGDTLRVSLTGNPLEEVRVGHRILQALQLEKDRPVLISCPTCGRCEIDLFSLAGRIDRYLEHVRKPITVAVMGCVVNGPGEAKEADVGVAGGRGAGILFKKGKIHKRLKEKELELALKQEIDTLVCAED